MSDHYPQRSYKTLIINAPKWFSHVYQIVKPMLREKTREKINIFSIGSTDLYPKLVDILGEDSIYSEWKEDCGIEVTQNPNEDTAPGPNSQIEKELRDYVLAQLDRRGEKMEVVTEEIKNLVTPTPTKAPKKKGKGWF